MGANLQKTLCLSQLGRGHRLALLSTLAFFGSQLMGQAFAPTINYFWGVGLGRILVGLALLFLPATNAGTFRPWLVILGIGVAVAGFDSAYTNLQLILIFALYLVLESCLDVTLFTHSTEQEVPFDLVSLALFRLAGMWCGLFVQLTPLREFANHHIPNAFGLLLVLFWLLCRENHEDSLLPDAWKQKKPSRLLLFETTGILKQGWVLLSLVNLLAVSVLAGLCAGAVLPYPLLHPDLASEWLLRVSPNLQMLGLGLLVLLVVEKLSLSVQLSLSAVWSSGLVLFYGLWGTAGDYVWGLLLASILLAGRAFLREAFRTEVIVRATLLVSLWTLGALSGALWGARASLGLVQGAQALCLTVTAVYAFSTYSRFAQAAKKIKKVIPPAVPERFGDSKQDFQAGPQPKTKRKRFKWQAFTNFVLVKLPVWLLLSVFLSAILVFGTHLVDSKISWEERIDSAAKTFRTQLFLSSLKRRLTEDMLASQRVPDDWAQFIATNFEEEGRPMDDVDPWGTSYDFVDEPRQIQILSAGPDRTFHTPDDLEIRVNKPDGVR